MLSSELTSGVVDVAVGLIVEEIAVYLGMRREITSADIEAGFEALSGVVVTECYEAVRTAHVLKCTAPTEAEGDKAFTRELRGYARAKARAWADDFVARRATCRPAVG